MDNLNLTNDRDASHNVWDEAASPTLADRMRSLDPATALSVIGGGALAAAGLRKRGLIGGLLVAAGGVLLYRALAGHNAAQDDQVDEAALESFPASDPPSH